jgi:hypothetical protein
MAIGIVGLSVSGVKKKQTFQFVNFNVFDAVITKCDALTGLPLRIEALYAEPATIGDVAPGDYPYSYTLEGREIIMDNPKIIVGN